MAARSDSDLAGKICSVALCKEEMGMKLLVDTHNRDYVTHVSQSALCCCTVPSWQVPTSSRFLYRRHKKCPWIMTTMMGLGISTK